MKKTILTFIIVLMFTAIFAFDALWQKAQEMAENSWMMVPGRTNFEMAFRQGRIVNQDYGFKGEIVHTLMEDKSVHNEIVSIEVREPGKDVQTLETFQDSDDFKEWSQQTNEDMTPSQENNIFLEKDTRNLRVRKQNQTRRIGRIECQSFDVRYTPSGRRADRVEGTVWLNIETGAPVLAEMRIPMLDQTVTRDISYTHLPETNQFVETREVYTETRSFMEMAMSIIITTTYSEHWEFPVE